MKEFVILDDGINEVAIKFDEVVSIQRAGKFGEVSVTMKNGINIFVPGNLTYVCGAIAKAKAEQLKVTC